MDLRFRPERRFPRDMSPFACVRVGRNGGANNGLDSDLQTSPSEKTSHSFQDTMNQKPYRAMLCGKVPYTAL
eukprot:6191139-Pleurochrysis_carterae.AAC.2